MTSSTSTESAPNVVLVMADDMGFSDLGCYGGEIETPALDGFADDGLQCTQFYNQARCCPSRASLLTGLYPHRAGMGWMTAKDLGTEEYAGDLSETCTTLPEALSERGYATYMSGKWHLTNREYVDADASKHSWPLQRGFDRFYGTIGGANNYFSPSDLTRGNERIEPPDEGFYYTDAISDEACRFVREHDERSEEDPFFLYVSYTAPHWPLHARAEDVETYRDVYERGWNALREERYDRLVEMGIVDDDWDLSPHDSTPWDDLDAETRERMTEKMALYAAQVDRMDQGVGRLRETLSEEGYLDDTLFLFLSDNGGCAEGGPYGWDGPMGDEGDVGEDMKPISSYGRYWANLSNTPFRRYKHWVHEGGISTPLIAHWPDRLPTDGGLVDTVGNVVDVMATCLDVAGDADSETPPLDGTSLLPAFEGEEIDRPPICWEHEANRAVRTDRWKLVSRGENGRWELYDMTADRTELTDLAGERPEVVDRLADHWTEYAEDVDVYPLDGRTHQERLEGTSEHLEH